jgi:hypothetical protein
VAGPGGRPAEGGLLESRVMMMARLRRRASCPGGREKAGQTGRGSVATGVNLQQIRETNVRGGLVCRRMKAIGNF